MNTDNATETPQPLIAVGAQVDRGVRRHSLRLRLRIWATETVYWYYRRPLERLRLRLVYLLPRSLVYWCAIRLIAHATTGKHGAQLVSELTAMDALDRWRYDAYRKAARARPQ